MNVLLAAGIRVLEFLFFGGWIGSLLVIVLSGIEDMETIFDKNEPTSRQPSPPRIRRELDV